LAAATLAVWQGANIIRTHDVRATVEALKLVSAVRQHRNR
jgi:dihydropteroate synthase